MEFLNKLIEETTRTYHIRHIRTTAYHPQGNDLTEWMNQTVKNTLAKIAKRTDEWDHYLPSTLFVVRTLRQETTRFSPFELVYGRDPRREYRVTQHDTGSHEDKVWEYVTRDLDRLQRIRKKAWRFIEKAQNCQQKKIMEKPKEMKRLKIGD